MRRRLGFAVILFVLLSFALTVKPEAALVTKQVKMRAGQKIRLKLKGVNEPLKWTVSSGGKYIRLRKNGKLKAKRTGKAVVQVDYRGVTYRFRVRIRARKRNQRKDVRIIEQYVPPRKVTEDKLVLIGDSRFAGMKRVVGGRAVWICAEGEGSLWLRDTVIPMLNRMDVKGRTIIFNLGVNDLTESSAYLSLLRPLGDKLKSRLANVCFVTVNPVDEKKEEEFGYKILNKDIQTFNRILIKGLKGFDIINTYDYLTKHSFRTVDGLHYTSDGYRMIYSAICGKIRA